MRFWLSVHAETSLRVMRKSVVFYFLIGALSGPVFAQVAGSAPANPAVAEAPMVDAGDAVSAQATLSSPSAATSVLSGFMEPYEYDPRGRKDPFAPPTIEKPLAPGLFHGPILPLQKYRLEELALLGIIWDVRKPRALVKDPSGKIHVLGPNAKLGNQNGYIAVIREGEIVVIETVEQGGKLSSSARIVKLASGAGVSAAN